MLPVDQISGPIYIIEDMWPGGTTAYVTSRIRDQEENNQFRVFNDENTICELNTLLESLKKTRHFQRKEVGVRIALFYHDDSAGVKHYLILYGDKEYNYYCMVNYSFKTHKYVEYKCRSQEEKDKLETIITVLEHYSSSF